MTVEPVVYENKGKKWRGPWFLKCALTLLLILFCLEEYVLAQIDSSAKYFEVINNGIHVMQRILYTLT